MVQNKLKVVKAMGYLIVGILLVCGIGLAYWGWRIYQRAASKRRYPTIEAHITRAEVVETHPTPRSTAYRPEVIYEYSVAGTTYKGHIKQEVDLFAARRAAEARLKGYIAGDYIQVHYNPANPSESMQKVYVPLFGLMLLWALSLGLLGIGLAVLAGVMNG